MKLSSTAALLIAAVSAFPAASAAPVALQGIIPGEDSFLQFANCDTKENCPTYGENSCNRINDECDGQCAWDGNSCIYPSIRNCKDIGNNRNLCLANNCDWVNNQCRDPTTNLRCSDYDNTSRSTCENKGCSWNSSTLSCDLVCRDFDGTSRSRCEKSGYCSWNNSNRRCNLKDCRDLDNTSRSECEIAGSCTWNNNSRICTSSSTRDCNHIFNRNQCLDNNCAWVNGECRPPTTNMRCSDYDRTSRSTCEDQGCSWNNSASTCRLVCMDFDNTSRSRCEKSGYCTWTSSSRYCDLTEPCGYYDNTSRNECLGANPNCFWNNSRRTCTLFQSEAEEAEEVEMEEE